MDGGIVAATVTSIVVIGGAVVGGFVRQNRAIGRLEGKFDGVKNTLDIMFNAHNQRITRLEDAENNRKRRKRD